MIALPNPPAAEWDHGLVLTFECWIETMWVMPRTQTTFRSYCITFPVPWNLAKLQLLFSLAWTSLSCGPFGPLEICNGLGIGQGENLVYFITWVLQLFITAINLAYPEWHIDTNLDSHGQSIVSRIRSGELGISVFILQTLWPRKYTHFQNWNEEKVMSHFDLGNTPIFKTETKRKWCHTVVPTLCDPMDSSLLLRPRDFLGKTTEVGYHFLLQGIFPTQGSNPGRNQLKFKKVDLLKMLPVPAALE